MYVCGMGLCVSLSGRQGQDEDFDKLVRAAGIDGFSAAELGLA